jgi:N-acetyl-anhydromuramoyl-L-alanine amidase
MGMAPKPFDAGGWWQGARQTSSPNFGSRPKGISVDLIVIHSISLPPGRYGGDAVEHLFLNQLDWDADPYFQSLRGLKVSSHFLIRRDGGVMQFVSALDRAWHAGESKHGHRLNCNDFSVGIELEGTEHDSFTDAQYRSLTQLIQYLTDLFPIKHVAGHEHIAPGRKTDPGPGFSWRRLASDLGWANQCFPILR